MNNTELNNLLGKIGKRIFVKYFLEFGNPNISSQEIIDLLPHEYTFKSRTSRTSKSRRIFREGLAAAALSIIATSDSVEPEVAIDASALLAQHRQHEGAQLQPIEETIHGTQKEIEQREAIEGERYKTEVIFRKRNRALIEAKKAKSDGLCEVCKFNFKERYGLAQDCLVAHHINPISGRTSASRTTLDDIAILCPNCHAVIHSTDELLSLDKLRQLLRNDVPHLNQGDGA